MFEMIGTLILIVVIALLQERSQKKAWNNGLKDKITVGVFAMQDTPYIDAYGYPIVDRRELFIADIDQYGHGKVANWVKEGKYYDMEKHPDPEAERHKEHRVW